mmetsp:Transcript_19260/g.27451  ORF Transcript_19260/g.27451 Transcript_19260/m.27451 type:complete len:336 (+) Transcript_19260:113-1120(+)|eukprot:CAMPEP_0172415828 /NCGR_PEP_ID=MMETSP1064-20121228/2262_1 /TAXON_ID=202472 /ORGANISM="Aulacoseira subarctica , Strain CCAP 1002/5" /LENGTH=335 /DNA_ID=CAMNT_0013153071 /DNA_START=64 /DNA_END=1071 /DNA_ORIENTATION=+
MNAAGGQVGGNAAAESLMRNQALTQSWFSGAPITKVITIVIFLLYITAETSKLHESLALDMDKVLVDGEFWRLITCHATFETLGEVIVGSLVLCPLLRSFEREMGSRKFSTFLFFICCIGTAWEFLLAGFLLPSNAESFGTIRASGPYSMLGATLFLFHKYTPRLYPRFVSILGFDFSEKAISYFFALQVIGSHGYYSVTPTVCGFIAGFICSTKALPISKWELPDFVYRCGASIGTPFVESRASAFTYLMETGRGTNRRRDAAGAALVPPVRRQHHPQNQPQPPDMNLPVAPPPPSEEAIETLMAMGFDRESVVRVLQECDNNLEVAANRLLGG